MINNKTKEENIRLLIKLVKAESALSDLWLEMDNDRSAYTHIDVDDVIKDIHKIRDKIASAIGWEVIFEKNNILEN